MRGLKTIFGQQIELKWDHYVLKIVTLNIYCVIDVFTKYARVKTLKDKKTKTVLNGFGEIVKESKRQPNKLGVDQEREFYNSHMQKWLDKNIF